MNKIALQGKMRQVRGNLKMGWAQLTDDDRRMLDGKLDQMVGLFQERYGDTRARSVKALTHYLEDYGLRRHGHAPRLTQSWPLIVASVGMAGFATAIAFAFAKRKSGHPDTAVEEPVGPDVFEFPEALFE